MTSLETVASDTPYPAIKKVLTQNKEEIGKTVREASASYERLVSLLGIDELNKEETSLKGVRYQIGMELQHYLDVFETYIRAGPEIRDKKHAIDIFADGRQQHPEAVYELLRHFGLEI